MSVNIIEYLGSKKELEKVDRLIGINSGRVFLSTAAQDSLVVSMRDCTLLSEALDVVCGQSFLSEGKYLKSGVLAAQEFSYGKFLPANTATWTDMLERGDRYRDDDELKKFWHMLNTETEELCITEEFNKGNYLSEGSSAMDIRSSGKTKSSKDITLVFTNSTEQFFAPIPLGTLKGLHALGAVVWLKFLTDLQEPLFTPEYRRPFFYFTIDGLRAVGAVKSDSQLSDKSGPRTTPDGRMLSHSACAVSWVSIGRAYGMIERGARYIQSVTRASGSPTEYLDKLLFSHTDDGLKRGISILRWNGMPDDEIDQNLSDIEDAFLKDQAQSIERESADALDRLQKTRDFHPALYNLDQLTKRLENINARIGTKYPGQVAEVDALMALRSYVNADDIPF